VLEKEVGPARHQSGRNSGVISLRSQVVVPVRYTTRRTNYVALVGPIAPILASTVAITVVVAKCENELTASLTHLALWWSRATQWALAQVR